MRDDIAQAFALLDSKGQAAITGMRAPGGIKKAFPKLDEFLPDERVLALATGYDPPPSMGQQRAMGAGSSLGAIAAAAKSGRLLVLTETNFWQVTATGMLNGNKPQGIQIRLGDITDVRARSSRGLMSKERFLMVDYLRGATVETELFSMNTDSELAVFAPLLEAQVRTVHDLIAEQEQQNRTPVVVQAAAPLSVADELAKLKGLVDTGVLSPDEFEQQKTKLLS